MKISQFGKLWFPGQLSFPAGTSWITGFAFGLVYFPSWKGSRLSPQQGAVGLGTPWSAEFPEEQLSGLHSCGRALLLFEQHQQSFSLSPARDGRGALGCCSIRNWMLIVPWILLWFGCNLPNCDLPISFLHHHSGHAWNIINWFFPSFSHTCNMPVLPAGAVDAPNQTLRLIICNLLQPSPPQLLPFLPISFHSSFALFLETVLFTLPIWRLAFKS